MWEEETQKKRKGSSPKYCEQQWLSLFHKGFAFCGLVSVTHSQIWLLSGDSLVFLFLPCLQQDFNLSPKSVFLSIFQTESLTLLSDKCCASCLGNMADQTPGTIIKPIPVFIFPAFLSCCPSLISHPTQPAPVQDPFLLGAASCLSGFKFTSGVNWRHLMGIAAGCVGGSHQSPSQHDTHTPLL